MITLIDDGVKLLLDIVESKIKEKKAITRKEAEKILSTDSMAFTLNAYNEIIGVSNNDFISILTGLNKPNPTQKDAMKRKFEEGFRLCYNLKTIDRLKKNLEAALKIDFNQATIKASEYLPKGTNIESKVYLTIDSFNPGMVYKGNVGRSILSGHENINMDKIAHEFHHIGFNNCFSKREWLYQKAHNPTDSGSVVIQFIYHLAMEGLANHYCSPLAVKRGPHKSVEANEKIASYEDCLSKMLEDTWRLIKDCMDGTVLFSEAVDHVNDFIIDSEAILPKVHFIGEKIISIIEEDQENSLMDIIEICTHPENQILLYDKTARKFGLPTLSVESLKKIMNLFSQAET